MRLRICLAAVAVGAAALTTSPASALPPSPDRGSYAPGAVGIGDPYFPTDGNGGYDVGNYDLDITYDPATDELTGTATITARAAQNLSAFNLDFEGLTVDSVTVGGRRASFSQADDELTVTPVRGLRNRSVFRTVVTYHGVPVIHDDPILGSAGWFNTDDGSLVVGEPDVAATWFPVNDHPSDKATYQIRITVPEGLTAMSNGSLRSTRTRHGWTTYTWRMAEPMASYLATATIGNFELDAYRADRIRYWDAVDSDLYVAEGGPATGDRFAHSSTADDSYKRLSHTITVPAEGATLSFAVDRNTEEEWDFFLVEAHTVGADDWTTLADTNGNTAESTGSSCPSWLDSHPFLTHYQTAGVEQSDPCLASGTSGEWHAATGSSDGYETWTVDLSPYAGSQVEVALSYVSDSVVQAGEVLIDDIEVSTGEGTTSFEDDGDVMDGWTVPGPPEGSPGNGDDWAAGTVADLVTPGTTIDAVLVRQPEIIATLAGYFGPYPFGEAGAIIDDTPGLGFALENQTRPIYAREFFSSEAQGTSVVVHELAHQWFGDSVAVDRWQDIWLNEGFATYAEWLWDEAKGQGTAQESFDAFYGAFHDWDEFWDVPIGDPGPDALFSSPVYYRGAMTLHELRVTVGDDAFFSILRTWAATREGGNGTTPELIDLAEEISGRDLGALFDAWLFGTDRPDSISYTPPDPAGDPGALASLATTGPAVHGAPTDGELRSLLGLAAADGAKR